jgi:DNA-directed RNA polymerase specialized sigma24 family protein
VYINAQSLRLYEEALSKLSEEDRRAVVYRIELRWSWKRIARAFELMNSDDARTVVSNAIAKLALLMGPR